MSISRIEHSAQVFTPQGSPAKVQRTDAQAADVKDQVSLGQTEQQTAAPKKWTIMHYSAADNNLTSFMLNDVNEMEKVGSTANMNLIVQLDKGGSDCKRYYITQDNDMKKINSPVLKDLGRTDTANPRTLGEFIGETMQKYPAEHFALIISDHGGGWTGAVEDVSHHTWMTNPMLEQGIKLGEELGGHKLDVLGYDACLMGNTESAYQMKDVARFYVASEETEGGNGWPYTPLLSPRALGEVERALSSKLNVTPEELATKIVSSAQGDQGTLPTMTAIDLAKMPDVAKATNVFADAIIKTDTPNATLQDLARKTQSFAANKDHYHFAELVATSPNIKDEKLKEAANGMMAAIKGAIIAEEHSQKYPNAHGLTAEIPRYGGVGSGYEDLKFHRDTNWAAAMNKMNGAPAPAAPTTPPDAAPAPQTPPQAPPQAPPSEQPAPEVEAQAAPAAPQLPTAKKKWTVLHYAAADNNLNEFIRGDINEMEKIGSTDTMNLVVQLDNGGSDCKRYYLTADPDPNKLNSPVLQDMGSTNMSDPKQLANFLIWGYKNFPSDHLAVIIGDHGGGWKGAVEDDSHNGWTSMPQVREALQEFKAATGKDIDILGWDACLMATSEVGYEVRDGVKYMVASEESEGGNGWSYTPLLTSKSLADINRALKQKLNIAPEEFAIKMVSNAAADQASLPTMSAIDISKIDQVAKSSTGLAQAIIATDTPNATLKALARKTQSYALGSKDQYHFCELIVNSKDIKDEKLKDAAKDLMASIKAAVIAEEHSNRYANSHGLTAEIPTNGGVGAGYKDLQFAKDTMWDEGMNKMSK
ncbi:MAG: clostripain-related cysteine peptidase [Firmicutes bacterium]|nr:clostripain-related cysteine peptidase [Bacillota bacterium]